ncbi:MAG TPA: translation initiation factor IF-2 [Firmicutes bacterium]|jgi:translation initiation factor IF-2|nr:translation initiation factor IF-2 [Bacillota bacterium]
MAKVRVYELSKELGINSKKLITVLRELNVDVKNHMSTMDEDIAKKVMDMLTKGEKIPIDVEKESGLEGAKGETAAVEKAYLEKTTPTPVKEKKSTGKKSVKEGRKARKIARQSLEEKDAPEKSLLLEGRVTVGELAARLNVMASEILAKLLDLGIIYNINQPLTEDLLELLSEEYGIKFKLKTDPDEEELVNMMEQVTDEQKKPRPPVVTVLGHVDHGKTSLLDAIRETNIIASEAGGITQHIGAYTVEINGKRVVFLDTPGHEAFTAMRARGAQITDIAVLVVAADDGVMPQTVEAINHAKAAGVPVIVALNKIDKPSANPERVKKQLADIGLLPEEWGGDTIFVNVSALKRQGLEELLEMILLVAEMAELKASYSRKAKGIVIEAKLDRGRGPVATILVQDGVLSIGDPVICGNIYGKVRAMIDDKGSRIKKAYPSTPVEVLGLTEVPQAGDSFLVVTDEKLARQIAQKRGEKLREATLRKEQRISLDDFFNRIADNEIDLNIIIKADVQGSAEALHESLMKIENEKVKIKIIHKGVGAITESDVMLASASDAVILGYNIRPEANARKLAEREQVDIRLYRVIYEIIDDVKSAIHGLLEPEYEEIVLGQAEIRQIFKVSKIGTVAGSYVLEGKISRNANMRVIRDGIVIHEGRIESLKRFKDDAKEVNTGFECGILLENFNDLKEGDILEAYEKRKVSA